jgi:hypothetical protein
MNTVALSDVHKFSHSGYSFIPDKDPTLIYVTIFDLVAVRAVVPLMPRALLPPTDANSQPRRQPGLRMLMD